MAHGTLFVISAPSGAGKSTLIEEIRPLFPDVVYSVSCTTRAPRENEKEGVHYYFLDRLQFDTMVKAGGFLEWKEVHGNRYGTPVQPVKDALDSGRCMILDIDVQGALQVFEKIDPSVGIFITVPDMAVLEKRLRQRGSDSEESIRTRLKNAFREIELGKKYRYQIVNDSLDAAVAELAAVIRKESRRCC
jgi:guanylate kinase